MADFLGFLAVGGGFVAVLGGFVWLAARIRRQGHGAAIMGPIDEVYHPGAHRARIEIEIHDERMVPTPSADDQFDEPGRPGQAVRAGGSG